MALYVAPSLKSDYALAKAYLSLDSGERALFTKAQRMHRIITIERNNRGDDRFDPQTNTLAWDPLSALRTTRGGRQSPALGLGHELAHAVESPQREGALSAQPLLHYDNAEERRVIRGSERHAAQTLGESIRFDHRGSAYRVATPVSR